MKSNVAVFLFLMRRRKTKCCDGTRLMENKDLIERVGHLLKLFEME